MRMTGKKVRKDEEQAKVLNVIDGRNWERYGNIGCYVVKMRKIEYSKNWELGCPNSLEKDQAEKCV